MPTMKIHAKNALFLVPEFALQHAGFIAGADGQKRGHTDPRMSTGSVFLSSIDGPDHVLAALCLGHAESAGSMLQTRMDEPVGWSALDTDLTDPNAILVKEEGIGNGQTRAVLAPARIDPSFGTVGPTREVSAIAPFTSDSSMLPEDVSLDADVLAALAGGTLRTVVSLFPGASIALGNPIPRASAMAQSTMGFRVHPDNQQALALPGATPDQVRKLCTDFNQAPTVAFDLGLAKAAATSRWASLPAIDPADGLASKIEARRIAQQPGDHTSRPAPSV